MIIAGTCIKRNVSFSVVYKIRNQKDDCRLNLFGGNATAFYDIRSAAGASRKRNHTEIFYFFFGKNSFK